MEKSFRPDLWKKSVSKGQRRFTRGQELVCGLDPLIKRQEKELEVSELKTLKMFILGVKRVDNEIISGPG